MGVNYLSAVDKRRASRWDIEFRGQMPIRPTEDELDSARADFFGFLDHVFELPVFQSLERGDLAKKAEDVERWREFATDESPENKGHLLLRPIGQTILAAAVGQLVKPREDGGKGMSLEAVFGKLKQLDEEGGFEAHRPETVWYGVTYDPKKQKMLMGNKTWAPSMLVYLVSGMDEIERQELWIDFLTTRIVDRDAKTWMDMDGEAVEFDLGRQELPAPI